MIRILPPDVANKIAAGEVVERPASIVKELSENALDAGATRIEISIEEGGMKLIQVADNGTGMDEQDCKKCLLRHATSKIEKAEDLFSLHTMGFRGEALASIASVSQFSLVTRKKEVPHGFAVSLGEDGYARVTPSPANQGTVVTVKNLFYNVPARKKFLKTPRTEFMHILRYLEDLAMVSPSIELRLTHNGKAIFHYLPETFESRVKAVLGQTIFQHLVPLTFKPSSGFALQGFVSKPSLIHATHKNQHLFVNQRPVYDHVISRAALEAYRTLIPRGYFPAFILAITVPPEEVDVNVHPRKAEVKFRNVGEVRGRVIAGIEQTLSKADLVQARAFPAPRYIPGQRYGSAVRSSENFGQPAITPRAVKSALEFTQDFLGGMRSLQPTLLEQRQYRILGQLHHSFIVVETPDGVQIFDQHAVSEIVNYHRLTHERENGSVESQQLLLPIAIELPAQDMHLVESNLEFLKPLGWEINTLTEKSIQITSAPSILKSEKMQEGLGAMLDVLKEEMTLNQNEKEQRLLKIEACRGAVMFGDALTIQEMSALLNQWLVTDDNESCEHGRPAVAKITVDEMKKFFRR